MPKLTSIRVPWLGLFAAFGAVACAASAPTPKPKPMLIAAPAPSAAASAAAVVAKPAFENHGGMWMPSQMPERAAELKKLGLTIDPALLADPKSSVLASIVNLNGCSASF